MKLAWHLACRSLLAQRAFSITMIINIGLGVLGYLVVEGFNDSFLAEIRSRTQATAAADLVVSTRNKPSDEIIANLKSMIPVGSEESVEQSLLTMAAGPSASRLVEIRFIDDKFPLYGNILLRDAGKQPERAGIQLRGTNNAWLYPELQSQLGVKVGETIKIGNVTYTIKDLVEDDPTTSGMGFVLAPRIYVSLDTAKQTGLIELGSRVQWIWRYKLAASVDVDKLEQTLQKHFKESNSLRIRSHRNSTEEVTRLQKYLNDYLGLVALAALFLATVGTSYMLRGQLFQTIKEFGIMVSLGATSKLPVLVFALQAVILGLAGSLLAILMSRLLLPILGKTMEPITGAIPLAPLSIDSIVVAITMAVLGGVLMALPLLRRLSTLKPAFLFQESSTPTLVLTWQTGVWYVPALFLWWLASVWQAHSWKNGTLFAVSFMGAAFLLAVIGLIFLRLLLRALPNLRIGWIFRLALTQIARGPLAALSTFLALALGTTLLNVIPQLKTSVAREIERPDSTIPQFFMFDIQDDQIDGLLDLAKSNAVQMTEPSAMIRAQLTKINQQAADDRKMNLEGEREQEQRENLQTRMQNLSFRAKLSKSETLVSGEFHGETWNGEGIPAISLEQDFAKRLRISLGDVLSFDISGIPVEGKVTSLRKVRWTSFEPNFFILFQPGVLEDAPKIWVTSAFDIKDDQRELVQSKIVSIWPNISVVDVKATVRRLLVMVDQISAAIGFVAILALLAGLGVLFAIVGHQARERRLSFALLKTLGAELRSVLATNLIEYGLLAVGAIALGTALSFGLSAVLCIYVFKTIWTADWQTPIITAVILLPVSVFLAYLACKRAVAQNVASLLR